MQSVGSRFSRSSLRPGASFGPSGVICRVHNAPITPRAQPQPAARSNGVSSGIGAAPRQRCSAVGTGGASQQAAATEPLTFRPATDADMEACRRLVLSEKMNPLGLEQRRLVVAASQNGDFLGMGQLVPLGPGLSEVRSVVVAEQHRGRGIGEALVRHLCSQSSDRIVLTTISRRKAFYERAGFKEVPLSAVPREMLFEVAAGTVAARIFANDSLVVMSLDSGTK